jgi:hypothetical protein
MVVRGIRIVALAVTLAACGEDRGGGDAGTGIGESSSSPASTSTAATPGGPTTGGESTGPDDGTTGGEATTAVPTDAGSSSGATTDVGTGTDTGSDTGTGACGHEFTDPHGDGSLRLSGDEVFELGPGPYEFSSICVEGQARLLVCDETTVYIGKDVTTIIGGLGIGAAGDVPATVHFHLEPGSDETYVYFNATTQPISLVLYGAGAHLYFAVIGAMGAAIDGQVMLNESTYLGGTPEFPPCP